MSKQIIISIKFIALLFALLLLVSFALDFGINKNTTSVFAKPNKICTNNGLPQIAVFSSSVGEMGYDCGIIENVIHKSVYNFSLTGTRFMQYKGLIEALNEVSKNTEIVVLSESIFSFEKLNAINDIERFLPCITNDYVYEGLYNLQPNLVFKCRYIPFYKYVVAGNNYYLQSLLGWKNYLTHKKNVDSLRGQTRVYRNWEADQDSIWKYAKPIPVNVDSEIVATYKTLLDKLVNNNKKVILAIMPMYLPKGQSIVDLSKFRDVLQSMANTKNIIFMDFSEAMVDKKYFYNAQHLNAFGAKIYSKLFADSLMKLIK